MGRRAAPAGETTFLRTHLVTLGLGATVLVLLLLSGPAAAALTSPTANAIVRLSTTITESTGGQDTCSYGSTGDDTRIEIRNSGGTVVGSWRKNDGGSFSVGWHTLNAYPNGVYNLRSYGRSITNGFFSCTSSGEFLISSISVVVQNRGFLVNVGSTSGAVGDPLAAAVRLTDEGGFPRSGHQVSFCLSGAACVSGVTDGDGIARASIPLGLPLGARTLTVQSAASPYVTSVGLVIPVQVLARPSQLSYEGERTDFALEAIDASARLVDGLTGAPLEGAAVSFHLGDLTLEATTDAQGFATAALDVDLPAGVYPLTVDYAGTATHAGSSASAMVAFLPRPTQLVVAGDASGYWDESTSPLATLTDALHGGPLDGKDVSFALGAASATVTTDADGAAVPTLTLGDVPASYALDATFAGDDVYAGSVASSSFEILRRPTATVYVGDAQGRRGYDATLEALVVDARREGVVLAAMPVRFTLASIEADATTDANGTAQADVTLALDPATYLVEAAMAGDAYYEPSAASAEFLVTWEHVFEDALGRGRVNMSLVTREIQLDVGGHAGAIKHVPDMRIVQAPAEAAAPALPDADCVEACVGTCMAGSLGCEDRFVILTFQDEELTIVAVFDLAQGTFAAYGAADGAPYSLAGGPASAPCDAAVPETCLAVSPTRRD